MKALELTGQRFGRLTVGSKSPIRSLNGQVRWNCICDCGNTTTVVGGSLTSGNTTSCGCLQKEIAGSFGRLNTTHGMYDTSEYRIWGLMINRCTNSNDRTYHRYGARGITVCERWLNSFEAFYEDMGPRPSLDHSIDRENNDLGYYKENCRWATRVEQQNNRGNNVFYINDGITKTIAEWSKIYGIERNKLHYRLIVAKWSFDRAINTP